MFNKIIKSLLTLIFLSAFTGCATWEGVKEDSNEAYQWSKEKVNEGAQYVKEKTE